MKEFSKEDLEAYNGTNGQPAYIAFNGKVYDVSKVFEGGEHGGAQAGIDITDDFGSGACPHEDDIFDDFNVVGTYKE